MDTHRITNADRRARQDLGLSYNPAKIGSSATVSGLIEAAMYLAAIRRDVAADADTFTADMIQSRIDTLESAASILDGEDDWLARVIEDQS